MKYKNLLSALGLTALVTSSVSAADFSTSPIVGETRVTFALELSYQVNGLSPKDPTTGKTVPGVKVASNSWTTALNPQNGSDTTAYTEAKVDIQKTKFGNKELLAELLFQNVITSIDGWYVSMFTNNAGNAYALYLRNVDTTRTPIRLDNTYIIFDPTINASTPIVNNLLASYSYKSKRRVKSNTDLGSEILVTAEASGSRKTSAQYPFDFKLTRFTTGRTTAPLDAGRISLDVSWKAAQNVSPVFWVPNSGKTSAVLLSGSRVITNELGASTATAVFVSGNISVSNGVSYTALPTGIAGS